MKVIEFAIKNKFSNSDQEVVKKMYGSEEKTEQEWFSILKGKINFNVDNYPKSKKLEIIEKMKNKKKENKEQETNK
jgi:hypothetical protein